MDSEILFRVLLLQDYNTRLVLTSTLLLGLSSGLIGTFLLLRRRALMGDALSHACLPGLAVAFLLLVALGGDGRSLPFLFLGALVFGLLGTGTVLLIRNFTRVKDDAAMGIVLSVFFGAGVALLGLIQNLPQASAAGLGSFLYGKTAALLLEDFFLIVGLTLLSTVVCLLFRKELLLLCFDENFARSSGFHPPRLDALLMVLLALVTVVGMQAVGLILILAFLIIPAAAARFWSDDVRFLLALSAGIGALSGYLGATLSALTPNLPAGAVIVLTATAFFLISFVFGSRRGLWWQWQHRHFSLRAPKEEVS
jgi:manganese/zinc/iron transport system permease protein